MAATKCRLRITFAKDGVLKYTSHLDLARVWERSLRRAGMPIAYSQGFNPRPKMQLAAALPLGHAGEAELLDVWLEQPVGLAEFAQATKPVLPAGLTLTEVRQVPLGEAALQTLVVSAEYAVTVEWDEEGKRVEERIERLLATGEITKERRGKSYDLRPLVERLWLEPVPEPEGIALGMVLAARQGATARPEAVIDALGMGSALAQHRRLRLITAEGPLTHG
ncbi:MAG: DUF2344 domain-containing protein [Anaerolineales bacterium]|nr:MAG: DUF2344 domain-containing protein [Anaerolineales bacterium]